MAALVHVGKQSAIPGRQRLTLVRWVQSRVRPRPIHEGRYRASCGLFGLTTTVSSMGCAHVAIERYGYRDWWAAEP